MYTFTERIGKRAQVDTPSGLVDVLRQTPLGNTYVGYVEKGTSTLVLLVPVSESQEAEIQTAYEEETGQSIAATMRPKTAKDFEDE